MKGRVATIEENAIERRSWLSRLDFVEFEWFVELEWVIILHSLIQPVHSLTTPL